jgi:hypothetical protein
MEIIIILGTVLQGAAISLGMGASTLAIINFFVAIADGTIDPGERKMMGVVYLVLRVAMVLILVTFVVLLATNYLAGKPVLVNSAQLTLIVVLYANAMLMTKRIMPSTVGPALQASTWYTLGILTTIVSLGFTAITYGQFLLGYVTVIVLAISIVNGMMAYLKK